MSARRGSRREGSLRDPRIQAKLGGCTGALRGLWKHAHCVTQDLRRAFAREVRGRGAAAPDFFVGPPTTTGALTSEGEPPSTFIPGRCVPPRFNISAGSPFDLPETRADCLKDGGSGRWKQLEGKACGGIRAEECGESTCQQGTPGTLLAMAESSAVDLHGTAHSVAPTHGNANSI